MFQKKNLNISESFGDVMIIKLLMTIGLMAVSVPAVGAIIGLGIGTKGEKFVYPAVLITWGAIIYMVWFR